MEGQLFVLPRLTLDTDFLPCTRYLCQNYHPWTHGCLTQHGAAARLPTEGLIPRQRKPGGGPRSWHPLAEPPRRPEAAGPQNGGVAFEMLSAPGGGPAQGAGRASQEAVRALPQCPTRGPVLPQPGVTVQEPHRGHGSGTSHCRPWGPTSKDVCLLYTPPLCGPRGLRSRRGRVSTTRPGNNPTDREAQTGRGPCGLPCLGLSRPGRGFCAACGAGS